MGIALGISPRGRGTPAGQKVPLVDWRVLAIGGGCHAGDLCLEAHLASGIGALDGTKSRFS